MTEREMSEISDRMRVILGRIAEPVVERLKEEDELQDAGKAMVAALLNELLTRPSPYIAILLLGVPPAIRQMLLARAMIAAAEVLTALAQDAEYKALVDK